MNFGALLPKHGRCRQDHLALVCGDDRLTFRRLNARVGAKFQRGSDVMIVDDFPRNVAGKTLKRVLQEQYGKAG